MEYKHQPVVFCPVCKNCCEAGKDPELGLVMICPGCKYKERSKEAIVYQSSSGQHKSRTRLPGDLALDPTLPVVQIACPKCAHTRVRKVQKDPANPNGELGVLFVCIECKTFF